MCGPYTGKRAKAHTIKHWVGGDYYHGPAHAAGAVFCSERCAAMWGLSNFWRAYEDLHWCQVTARWAHTDESDCEDCQGGQEAANATARIEVIK